MIDLQHLNTLQGVQIFEGPTSPGVRNFVWQKPKNLTMCSLVLHASGGPGGAGAIGPAGAAAGGGGGASGTGVSLIFPLWAVPDVLYVTLGMLADSKVSVVPESVSVTDNFAYGRYGLAGGNASGSTPGVGGLASFALNLSDFPLGNPWQKRSMTSYIGGSSGGSTGPGVNGTILYGGAVGQIIVIGGYGGAGVGTTGSTGSQGGGLAAVASPMFTGHSGGVGGTDPLTPPQPGNPGRMAAQGVFRFLGGTGGGSTHGSATGTGLVQASGGDGAPGCGGGGSGGALTGSTPGVPGKGGPAFAIFTCW